MKMSVEQEGLFHCVLAQQEWLPEFVQSSYRLSNCGREPTRAEISAHGGLLMCETLGRCNLDVFMSYAEPGTTVRGLRDGRLVDPQPGAALDELLARAARRALSADQLAAEFRALRPYTDANARCSRALWMWAMVRRPLRTRPSGILAGASGRVDAKRTGSTVH